MTRDVALKLVPREFKCATLYSKLIPGRTDMLFGLVKSI